MVLNIKALNEAPPRGRQTEGKTKLTTLIRDDRQIDVVLGPN
jgi:hypothetical protein